MGGCLKGGGAEGFCCDNATCVCVCVYVCVLQAGSYDLVLPWHVHCSTALCLVNALARHLPHHPGGRDYTPGSAVSKVHTPCMYMWACQ